MRKWLITIALVVLGTTVLVAQRPNVKSTEIVFVDGQNFYLHDVVKGETLYSLSKLYNVPIDRIEFDNPQLKDGLKADQTIKIYCLDKPEVKMSAKKMARTFTEHTVGIGETTYSIARRYSLSMSVLVQDNPGLDPANLTPGQVLKIRKSEIGETSPRKLMDEMDDYAATLNTVSEGYVYHVVEMGETIYALSRKYNVTQEAITSNNDVAGGLRAGAMIKIPVEGKSKPTDVVVVELPAEQVEIDLSGPITMPYYVYQGKLDIAMLLPLSGPRVSASNKSNFVELYQGALIALEEFKNKGYTIELNLYDTQRSIEETERIVNSPDFAFSDLIIGPVYDEGVSTVMKVAEDRKVPVVSPLANFSNSYGDLFYQMAPSPETKYDKIKDMFDGDKNVVVFAADSVDTEFERDMMELIGEKPFERIVYNKDVTADYVDSLLVDSHRENLYVVVAGDELGVENILAAISSVQNNRLARSIRTGPMKVIGSARWTRYQGLDRNLFFKLNVSFVTNYYADRNFVQVEEFDRRYMAEFNHVPSLYAYRGYDAVKLFVGAMVGASDKDFLERLGEVPTPLQSPYKFDRNSYRNMCNDQWSLVSYRNNYTITVK